MEAPGRTVRRLASWLTRLAAAGLAALALAAGALAGCDGAGGRDPAATLAWARGVATRHFGLGPRPLLCQRLPVRDRTGRTIAHQIVLAPTAGDCDAADRLVTVAVRVDRARHALRYAHEGPPVWRGGLARAGEALAACRVVALRPAPVLLERVVVLECPGRPPLDWDTWRDRPARLSEAVRVDPGLPERVRRLRPLAPPPPLSAARRGAARFLDGASRATVTSRLRPRGQDAACPCCVCWETALANLLAWWDRRPFDGDGPWPELLPGWADAVAPDGGFEHLTGQLCAAHFGTCAPGPDGLCANGARRGGGGATARDVRDAAERVVNGWRGYAFAFDVRGVDGPLRVATHVAPEIEADKPVFYLLVDWFAPFGPHERCRGDEDCRPSGEPAALCEAACEPASGVCLLAHAVTIVGCSVPDEVVFVYPNGPQRRHAGVAPPEPIALGFDPLSSHAVIQVTPMPRLAVGP